MSTITAKVIQDDSPESPRSVWDNLGTMVCWHPHYNLGDEQIHRDDAQETYDDLDEGCEVLPLYLYDHSGITMSTSAFSCPWDSGMVGFIYVTAERIRAEYGDDNPETREKVRQCLQGEVKVYDEFIRGSVYGFVIEKHVKCECCGHEKPERVDDCWGFYGDCLEDMIGQAGEEYRPALTAAWEERFG